MKLTRTILTAPLLCAAVLLSSCVGKARKGADTETGPATETRLAADGSLELPSVPQELRDPVQRADYVALHFWDALAPGDAITADTLFMEQTFSNYSTVLPLATPMGRAKAVKHLLETQIPSRDMILRMAAKYLYEPASPTYDEDAYLPFAQSILAEDPDNPEVREAIATISRNRPGSEAPRFEYESRDGERKKLTFGIPTVLMFYEPDCEQCKSAIEVLRGAPYIEGGDIRLVAIYIGDNEKMWREHAATLPKRWEVGIDRDFAIDDAELYQIRATPTFYIIDAEGTILVKNARESDLLRYLGLR